MIQVPSPLGATHLLLRGVGRANAAVGGAVSIIAGVVTRAYMPDTKIYLWVFVAVTLLGIWFSVAALLALSQSVQQTREIRTAYDNQQPTTRVVSVVAPFFPYKVCKCILIVEWSPAAELPVGTPVTVSIVESTHELPLGTGTVRPKQQDGKARVTLDNLYPDTEKHVSVILGESTRDDSVKKLRIGPAFTMQGIFSEPYVAQVSASGDPDQANIGLATPCSGTTSESES